MEGHEPIEVTEATRKAEGEEALARHEADRLPTAEEEEALKDEPLDTSVGEHYTEMMERGVGQRGEGHIP